MTHWQPSIRIEKVPIPVRGNKAQEHINEIDYDFKIFKIGIIVSCWKTSKESTYSIYFLLYCGRYTNAIAVCGFQHDKYLSCGKSCSRPNHQGIKGKKIIQFTNIYNQHKNVGKQKSKI